MPVLVRGSVFRGVYGLKRSISSVEFELMVGLMLGLVVFVWHVEMFTLFEEWSDILQ